ncbi:MULTISPECIES: hypothetical protein [Cysteiniphilum]|uniref:LepB N-terminal domain-containing protein n=1 Tax=Cysteiniphilum litorale TaxID=2056700 RepID=A0A8J2Z554_9GAMM|nr:MULTISPECIES: hypothetical protein [Cysteiniphilum]GGG01159.1 hypothetical protein GCM10010995_18230 [Cysteiniphilum litorale]
MEIAFAHVTERVTANKVDPAQKIDGKNSRDGNPYNGFYRLSKKDQSLEAGDEYFIKVPIDKTEFFFEALAARIIAKLKEKNIIPQEYQHLFVTAEPVIIIDGDKKTKALASKKAKVTELFKLFFPWEESKLRNNKLEKFDNKYLYQLITSFKSANSGLSMVIFISLLLGDYSVHSGNVFGISGDDGKLSFGKLDFGAAFRDFTKNKSLIKPHEYEANLYKKWYKNYIEYYLRIPGFKASLEEVREKFSEGDIGKIKRCFNEGFDECYTFFELNNHQAMCQKLSKYSGIDFADQQRRESQFETALSDRLTSPLVATEAGENVKTYKKYNTIENPVYELNNCNRQACDGEQKPLLTKSHSVETNLWAILKSNYEHKKDDTSDDIKAVFTSLMKIYAHMLGKNASKRMVHNADLRTEKYDILHQLIQGIGNILITEGSNELKGSKYKQVVEQFEAIEKDGGLNILDKHSSEVMEILRTLVNWFLVLISFVSPNVKNLLAPKSATLFNQAKNTLTQTSETQFNAQFQDQLAIGQQIESHPTK